MTYRILSLDGGGAWALIQVAALQNLFGADTRGHDVLRHFHLAAANSGGSIVLGGLIGNLPLSEIRSYFEDGDKRRAIFTKTNNLFDRFLELAFGFGPKYVAEAKRAALMKLLPAACRKPMPEAVKGIAGAGDEDLRLLISAFDYDRNRAVFFRSAESGGAGWGDGAASSVSIAEAIHASTNAPVNYFDAPAQFPGQSGRYWDGGVAGCNNPVLAAVTEGVVLTREPRHLVALSIGNGAVALPRARPGEQDSPLLQARAKRGLVRDLTKLAESILDDPPDIASFLAHVLTGGPLDAHQPRRSRIIRMSPLISPFGAPGGWEAPPALGLDAFVRLTQIGMDAVEDAEVQAIGEFADLWLKDEIRNQPVRLNGDTLACEIGYERFNEAKAEWRTRLAEPVTSAPRPSPPAGSA